jgi:hypothetical protein
MHHLHVGCGGQLLLDFGHFRTAPGMAELKQEILAKNQAE